MAVIKKLIIVLESLVLLIILIMKFIKIKIDRKESNLFIYFYTFQIYCSKKFLESFFQNKLFVWRVLLRFLFLWNFQEIPHFLYVGWLLIYIIRNFSQVQPSFEFTSVTAIVHLTKFPYVSRETLSLIRLNYVDKFAPSKFFTQINILTVSWTGHFSLNIQSKTTKRNYLSKATFLINNYGKTNEQKNLWHSCYLCISFESFWLC